MARFLWLPLWAGALGSVGVGVGVPGAIVSGAVVSAAIVSGAVLSGARADDLSSSDGAAQVVGLFMQSCIRFAGDPTGLRKWAPTAGIQPLPAKGQQAFLYGLPGEVFDASTKQGKLVRFQRIPVPAPRWRSWSAGPRW